MSEITLIRWTNWRRDTTTQKHSLVYLGIWSQFSTHISKCIPLGARTYKNKKMLVYSNFDEVSNRKKKNVFRCFSHVKRAEIWNIVQQNHTSFTACLSITLLPWYTHIRTYTHLHTHTYIYLHTHSYTCAHRCILSSRSESASFIINVDVILPSFFRTITLTLF